MQLLSKLLTSIAGLATLVGVSVNDIGSHSNRKGAISYVLMFVTISAVQVYLRAGWSLGNVPDRYIFAGPGGDELVGRTVNGLPTGDRKFSVLPPHFDNEALAALNSIGWDRIYDGYSRFPPGLQRCMPFLLASLLYHHDWLKAKLWKSHPLWNARVYTLEVTNSDGSTSLLVDKFKSTVLLSCGMCEKTGMQASGIPPHLVISLEIAELRTELKNSLTSVRSDLAALKESILEKLETLPDSLKAKVLNNFSVDNVLPITRDEVQSLLRSGLDDMVSKMAEVMQSQGAAVAIEATAGCAVRSSFSTELTTITTYNTNFRWIGELGGRWLPEHYNFPSTTMKPLWNMWHFGQVIDGEHIVPFYRLCTHKNDLVGKANHIKLCRANRIMNVMYQCLIEYDFFPDDVNSPETAAQYISTQPAIESDALFDCAFLYLINECYPRKYPCVNVNQIVYNTLCNHLPR